MSTGTETAGDASLARIVALSADVRRVAVDKVRRIQKITSQVNILALNAMIESTRAGAYGRGFAVVAQEVRSIGGEVATVARELESDLNGRIGDLQTQIEGMSAQVQGERLVDLALNAVELIDRNLYERSCDVRWWATDSAMVECAGEPDAERVRHACGRLGVILSAYTVYVDLWLCALDGTILANGRPGRHPAIGRNVASEPWFRQAAAFRSGDDYAAADVARQSLLDGAPVATFATAVRAGGAVDGRPVGVLAIHFDWEPQAQAIVFGVRVAAADRARTRVLLVDAGRRVIAASDGVGVLEERIDLDFGDDASGHRRRPDGGVAAFHRTPGYETYRGLGWSGVILQAVR